MKRAVCVLMAMLFIAPVFGGGREGHGGDPYWYRFYHRAKFGFYDMKKRQLVSPELLKIYEEALNELSFEITDDTLDTTGRVVDDPQRPGKQWVRVDRGKFKQFFEGKQPAKDLIAFVVHEVFETKGRDLQKEITRDILFSEDAYGKWLLEEYEREKGAGNGVVAPSSFLDDLSFAGLKQMFDSPESKAPTRAELLGNDPTSNFTGRCVRSVETDPKNALLNVLATKDGAFKYYMVTNPEQGPAWFDEKFAKVMPDIDSYTVANSFEGAEAREGALIDISPSLQVKFALKKHGDLYYMLQTSTDPKVTSVRACVFFRQVSKHNAFEAMDATFDTIDVRKSLPESWLFKGKDAFTLSLRCYNSGDYADKPTNGVLVGYQDRERGDKIFAFMSPGSPAELYDHTTFSKEQLQAVDWAKDVGYALATPDEWQSDLNNPDNRLGFRVRRFDDYKISGERCEGDHDDGSFEVVRLVKLEMKNGALVPGATAWACSSYEAYVPPAPRPYYDADPPRVTRRRKNFATPWPPYYPYP